jgi:hypothetical protein
MEKVEISNDYYKNMVSLLENEPELFERYAMEDAKIALAYYCHTMNKYFNNITNRLVEQEPITTSDATTKYFVK